MKLASAPQTAPQQESTGMRKAALLMHGLGVQDRQWMLERLSSSQREVLDPLLEELAALGLPPNASLVQELLQAHEIQAAVPQEPFSLAQVLAEDVLRIMRDEPVELIVTLLGVRQWPWQNEFLALLPLIKRKLVQEALIRLNQAYAKGRPRAKAFEAAMLHELELLIAGLQPREQPRAKDILAFPRKILGFMSQRSRAGMARRFQ
jgi:hypothetical protein